MMRVVLSPQTAIDLEETGDYIARDNPRHAVTFIAEIQSKCLRLGHAPSIGTARPELGEGVRMLPHGRYLIFYRDCASTEKSLAQLFLKPHLDERLVRNVARVRGHLDGIQQVL